MTDKILPDPATPFGARVQDRLTGEHVIWFTTVGADGTPQPNPVWFVAEDDHVLIYNRPDAYRLKHIESRPQVSLHFDGDGRGGDIVVLRGIARVVDDVPGPHEHAVYADKYAEAMRRVSGSAEAFAETYSVPVRVDITRVRGF